MIGILELGWFTLWIMEAVVISKAIGPRAWASYVVPAEAEIAVRADRLAAERARRPAEVFAAIGDRLAVRHHDGTLICPGCNGGDYGPTDSWLRLELFYRLSQGEIPDVVRASCLDCGTATHATTETVSHYIPPEYLTTNQEGATS